MTTSGHELARTQSAAPVPSSESDRRERADWQGTLDQLEHDVCQAEVLAAGLRMTGEQWESQPLGGEELSLASSSESELAPWEPPPNQPPMPAEFAERARALLDRQIAIAAQIAREITMGRQQAAYAQHIEGLEEVRPIPAFIDEAV